MTDTVAIVGGTGPEGRGLALRFARAGVPVVVGSRDAARAAEIAAGLAPGDGLALSGAANPDAASQADIVLVAVPWEGHERTIRDLADVLAGKLVVDIVNPLEFDDRGPVTIRVPEGSAAEQAAALLPRSTVVAGFHHVSAKHLVDESHPVDTDVLVCGDDRAAKDRVIALAERVPGVRGIDAGLLRMAHILEDWTSVLLSVNRGYRTSAGIRLSDLDPARRRP
ncbi:MAG TPA: NADPH-dependent F420 reductase [Acidimicrobiales bacterium]|nr:NADPH-dependent F420 reductase [Acidimicrobiales bacterium]